MWKNVKKHFLKICLYLGPFKYTVVHEEYTIFSFSGSKTNHLVFKKNIFHRSMNVQNCKYIFVTGVSQGSSWTVLKTDSGHVALLTEIFFKRYPERFFSNLKKTIVDELTIRDGCGDLYEWRKTCIFLIKIFLVYRLFGQSILE